MNYSQIKATIEELTRYIDRGLLHRHGGGAYIRSTIIPRATRAEALKAEKLADRGITHRLYHEWIPLKHLVTAQRMLCIKSLRYAARTYPKHQRAGDKLPVLVRVGRNRYAVWDGNHRATIGLMIDPAMRLRCYVIRERNRKKGLRPR